MGSTATGAVMAASGSLPEDLSTEIEALESIYSESGEFSQELSGADSDTDYCCVIRLKPATLCIGLQISIPDGYPDTSPKIEFLQTDESESATDLSDALMAELLQHLYQTAGDNKGSPMCFTLVESARDWLADRQEMMDEAPEANDVNQTEESNKTDEGEESDETSKHLKRINKKVKGQKKKPEEDKIKGKKPRMKTATEVISRILWDEQLSKEHFVIGYLDRFIGIIEKSFTEFSWEDIASVDYDTLAIPKHRIQYFKYKDEIVWDKTKRLDDVFGSTGSQVTIIDVIKKYQKENNSVEEKESDESQDGDSDDDIPDGYGEVSKAGKQRKSNRPNYFIAIRIDNSDIVDQVEQVQSEICKLDDSLEETCTSLKQLHVTLATLRLNTPSEMERAIDVLKEQQSALKSLLAPATLLRFQGLQTFHNRVLCSVPQYNPIVLKLADHICSAMDNEGLRVVGTPHSFTPHLTVLKIRRKQINQGHKGYLDQRVYESHMSTEFGVQNIDRLHLCSMLDSPQADGFYYSLASVDVSPES